MSRRPTRAADRLAMVALLVAFATTPAVLHAQSAGDARTLVFTALLDGKPRRRHACKAPPRRPQDGPIDLWYGLDGAWIGLDATVKGRRLSDRLK